MEALTPGSTVGSTHSEAQILVSHQPALGRPYSQAAHLGLASPLPGGVQGNSSWSEGSRVLMIIIR